MPVVAAVWIALWIAPMPAMAYVASRLTRRRAAHQRIAPAVADASGWFTGTLLLALVLPLTFGSSPGWVDLWAVGVPVIAAYLLALPVAVLPGTERSRHLTQLFGWTLFVIGAIFLVVRTFIDSFG